MNNYPTLSGQKINILFLGGSNTMMKSGYSGETVKALGEYFDIGRVDNLAIGGTAVGMGLYTTLNPNFAHGYDLIFLAYSISDYSYMKSPTKLANWRWAFENLLQNLRQNNPRARIHTLLFGRRGRQNGPSTKSLFQVTGEISEQYNAHPINVDAYLHGFLKADESDKRLYEDESHYARPLVSALAANYIARMVIATDHKLQTNPQPESPMAASCDVRQADHRFFSALGEAQHFKNSLYDVNAVRLQIDGDWQELTIPGALRQLNYVSTKSSARILVAEEGEAPVAFDTLHKRVDNGEFAFLIRGLLFSWKVPTDDVGTPRKVALRAVTETSVDSPDFKYIKQFNMMPPNTPEQNNVVYLSGALFS